jgi:hypothetical protein
MPYMGWLYIGIALAVASLTVLLRRLLTHSARRRVDPWVSLLFGAGSFIAYALESGHSPFLLAIGVTCLVAGGLAWLILSRRSTSSGGGSREVTP